LRRSRLCLGVAAAATRRNDGHAIYSDSSRRQSFGYEAVHEWAKHEPNVCRGNVKINTRIARLADVSVKDTVGASIECGLAY